MASDSGKYALLDQLADEFTARCRRGEHPCLKEYVDRYPDLADDIRELFPAMVEIEKAEEDRQEMDAPAAASAPPLEQLGDFRILREVGRGGMGVVYEAEQVSLGRHVALKVLPEKLLPDAKARRRFEREAKAAAKLHHTNIVPVFGVGEHEGHAYYVMQFIHGLSLDVVLDELKQLKDSGIHGAGLASGPLAPATLSYKDVSAADLARSLASGDFQAVPEDSPSGDEVAEQARTVTQRCAPVR